MAYWQGGKLYDPKDELTPAPELPDVVVFDIADGAFDFYTKAQFESYIDNLRYELVDEGLVESCEGLDFDDVLDMVHGEEFFWEWLPKEVK